MSELNQVLHGSSLSGSTASCEGAGCNAPYSAAQELAEHVVDSADLLGAYMTHVVASLCSIREYKQYGDERGGGGEEEERDHDMPSAGSGGSHVETTRSVESYVSELETLARGRSVSQIVKDLHDWRDVHMVTVDLFMRRAVIDINQQAISGEAPIRIVRVVFSYAAGFTVLNGPAPHEAFESLLSLVMTCFPR